MARSRDLTEDGTKRENRTGRPIRHSEFPRMTEEGKMAKDPVCGMTVEEKTAPASYVYNGTTYYFCHASCKAKFEKNPGPFLTK